MDRDKKGRFIKGHKNLSTYRFPSGHLSHNKGKTKENYEPLKRMAKTQSKEKKRLFRENKLKIWNKGLTKENPKVALYSKKCSETKKRLFKEGKLKTNKNGFYKLCENCKKQIWVTQSEKDKKKYCSKKCFGKANKGKKPWNYKLTKELDERVRILSKISGETRKRLYKEGKIIPPMLGKKHTEESKLKDKISMKEWWKNPDNRIKILNDEMLKRRLQGLLKRPTSYEQKISDLCFKYRLPFIYKGNGDFLINFKNPDFVNEKEKIVIEVFYSWFKIRDYGSVENYKEFCRDKYNSAGWKVIFIDENDLNCENWEEICLNKINKENLLIKEDLKRVDINKIEEVFD